MGILGIARTVGKVADNAADAAQTVARNKAVTGLMTKAEDAIPSTAFTKAIDDIPTQPVTRQVSNAEYDSAWSLFEDINTPEEWQSAVKKTVAGDRDITGNSPIRRTPELEASAKKLIDDKLITREEHLANIAENKPINDWDQLPREPSSKSVVYALKPKQRSDGRFLVPKEDADRLGVEVATLKSGDKFNGRLDIPAYQNYDTWIVAGTKAGEQGTTYAKAIHYTSGEGKPVRFLASQKTSEKIGKAEAEKTGYATISGYYKDSSPEELRILSERYLNDPEWSQVGFDPRRLGSFYLRKANDLVGDVGTPLGEADEVIQIGPLVLAKNAKAIEGYSGYNKGGVVTPMNFNKGGTPMLGKQMELFADGGLKDQGGSVDEVSGNDVPVGSLKEEVRDDIPAKLSEGEFVLSADVVRFYGLAHIMKMRDVAKAGLAKMDAMGQMGNSDQAIMEDDMPFSMEDLEVEDEEGNSLEYADGGYVRKFEVGGYNPSTGVNTSTNTGITMQAPVTSFTPQPVTTQSPTAYQPIAAPTTGYTPAFGTQPQQQELPTFQQVLPSTQTGEKIVKYKNAAGDVIDVWVDSNGKPIYPVPDGYSLSSEATAPTAPAAPSVEAPVAPQQRDNSDNNDNRPEPRQKSVKWDDLDYKGIADLSAELNTTQAKVATTLFSPLGAQNMMNHQKGKLRSAIENEFLNQKDPKVQAELSAMYELNQPSGFLGGVFGKKEKTSLAAAVEANKIAYAKANPGKTLSYIEPKSVTAAKAAKVIYDKAKPEQKIAITKANASADAAAAKRAAHSNQGAIQEAEDSGYTGSTLDGIAVNRIAGVNGQVGGVVAHDKGSTDDNGKDIGGTVVRSSSNKTVFENSAGEKYTTGIFGSNAKIVEKDASGTYVETAKKPSNTDKGEPASDGTAICTAFRNLGYLPDDIWALDDIFGKSLEKTNPIMVKGYRLWAVPVAKFIQTNTLLARTLRAIMWPVTKAWANEMAYRLKPEMYKPSLSGKAIMLLGGSVCSAIGYVHKMSSKQNGELV